MRTGRKLLVITNVLFLISCRNQSVESNRMKYSSYRPMDNFNKHVVNNTRYKYNNPSNPRGNTKSLSNQNSSKCNCLFCAQLVSYIPIRNENDSKKHQLGDNSRLSGNNNSNLNSDEYNSESPLYSHRKQRKKYVYDTNTYSPVENETCESSKPMNINKNNNAFSNSFNPNNNKMIYLRAPLNVNSRMNKGGLILKMIYINSKNVVYKSSDSNTGNKPLNYKIHSNVTNKGQIPIQPKVFLYNELPKCIKPPQFNNNSQQFKKPTSSRYLKSKQTINFKNNNSTNVYDKRKERCKKLKKFYCPCHLKIWKDSYGYNRHMMIANNCRPFRCIAKGCNKTFRQKVHLKNHLKSYKHTGFKRFKCKYCGLGLCSLRTLNRHISNFHYI